MKKIRIFAAMILILATLAVSLSGCAYDILYGEWNLEGTELQDGSNLEPYPIAMTLELTRDGGAYMYDTLFGEFKLDGYRFEMVTLSTGEIISGSWTLVDNYLLLYPDGTELVYRFSAVNRD